MQLELIVKLVFVIYFIMVLVRRGLAFVYIPGLLVVYVLIHWSVFQICNVGYNLVLVVLRPPKNELVLHNLIRFAENHDLVIRPFA